MNKRISMDTPEEHRRDSMPLTRLVAMQDAEIAELTRERDELAQQRGELLKRVLELEGEHKRLQAEAAKSERRAITFGDIVHQQVLAMRAAYVAWQRDGANVGMSWIANTLCGPGHLPNQADIALGAQALFDKEVAEQEAFRAAHPAPEGQA
jgi:hypothetical protein